MLGDGPPCAMDNIMNAPADLYLPFGNAVTINIGTPLDSSRRTCVIFLETKR